MAKLYLAALLAVGAASVQAQPLSPTVPVQPSVDSVETRQALRDLSVCLAEARPGWARRTLSHPYLSESQARVAAESLRGTDNCIRGPEAELTLRTSGMVGSLAEHFLRAEIGRVDLARLGAALATMPPLNASEDFALCVAARHPAAARALALSEPGSDAEMQAVGQIARGIGPCTNQGEQLTVDLQALRALTSTALYRGVTSVLSARN